MLKVGNETRDHLLQADPETFFVTDHYVGYPMVLAHLDRLSAADLKKLLMRAMDTKKSNRVILSTAKDLCVQRVKSSLRSG